MLTLAVGSSSAALAPMVSAHSTYGNASVHLPTMHFGFKGSQPSSHLFMPTTPISSFKAAVATVDSNDLSSSSQNPPDKVLDSFFTFLFDLLDPGHILAKNLTITLNFFIIFSAHLNCRNLKGYYFSNGLMVSAHQQIDYYSLTKKIICA